MGETAVEELIADADQPEATFMAPADGELIGGGVGSYVIGGTAVDDASWVTDVQLTLPGESVTAEGTGTWAYTWSLPTDGNYTLTAVASDAVGHPSAPDSVDVMVDNTAPVPTLDLADGAVISGGTGNVITITLSGGASDNLSGLTRVQLSVDGPWTDAFQWNPQTTVDFNQGQPVGVSVNLEMDSPQAQDAFHGPNEILDLVFTLDNLEQREISGLQLDVNTTTGFNFTGVDGATCNDCNTARYVVDVPIMPPTSTHTITVTGQLAAGLSAVTAVSFTDDFTDTGSSDTHTILWEFGDGHTANELAPTHTFASAGVYTATLTVTDDDGGAGHDQVVITVGNALSTVTASADPMTVSTVTAVSFTGFFTDTDQADTHTVLWEFGDGATANTLTTSHVYTNSGNYTANTDHY